MLPGFKKLSDPEADLMYRSPLLVCLLIAGADGTVDRSEIKEAIATSQKKSKGNKALTEFYELVTEDFEDKLKILLRDYPTAAAERSNVISRELEGLNKAFPKIDIKLAQDIYDSLKALALNTAKSSGGIFGIQSIGPEEAKLVGLGMITPPQG